MTDDNGSDGKDQDFNMRLSALLNELHQSDFVFQKAGLADFAGIPYGLQLLAVMAHGATGREATREEQEDAETLAAVARDEAFVAASQLSLALSPLMHADAQPDSILPLATVRRGVDTKAAEAIVNLAVFGIVRLAADLICIPAAVEAA